MRPCFARICSGGPRHIGGFADVERDRLGLAAGLDDLADHPFQRILAAPGNHDGPAIRRQRLRAGLADAAAPARHPCHAFPVI